MCQLKILNRTSNGFLLFCQRKNTYNVSFSNLTFNFNTVEMDNFIDYLDKIDCTYWEKEYANSIYEKKIPIPTLQTNFIILLDSKDLEELRALLDFKGKKPFLKSGEINYRLVYN